MRLKTRELLWILWILLVVILVMDIRNIRPNNESYTNREAKKLKVLYTDDIGNLKRTVLIYPGMIALWPNPIAPLGWAICDGTNGTPDLRGKFVVGATYGTLEDRNDRVLPNIKVGDQGGRSEIQLGIENLPTHGHDHSYVYKKNEIEIEDAGDHDHTYQTLRQTNTDPEARIGHSYTSDGGFNQYITDCSHDKSSKSIFGDLGRCMRPVGNHTHSFGEVENPVRHNVKSFGGNTVFKNLPPYIKLNYIMKL